MPTRRDRNMKPPMEVTRLEETDTILKGVIRVMNSKLDTLTEKIEWGFKNLPDRMTTLQSMVEVIRETHTQATIRETTDPSLTPGPFNQFRGQGLLVGYLEAPPRENSRVVHLVDNLEGECYPPRGLVVSDIPGNPQMIAIANGTLFLTKVPYDPRATPN